MLCPECNIEMRVERVGENITQVCRNSRCEQYEKAVQLIEEDETAEVCSEEAADEQI